MQARDEVGVLLLFDDLLKLKRKLAGNFNFVRLYDVLDNDDERRLKERRICLWVQDRCTGLE
jgi:hypothetical protein